MNIKDLQYYVSLTQLKNFSLVAAQFHVSQPTISAAIRRLETELKTQLLIRANPTYPWHSPRPGFKSNDTPIRSY